MGTDQTNYTTEDDAKAQIIEFLQIYKRVVVNNTEPNTADNYLTLINGGTVKGIKITNGFLALKINILKLMNLSTENNNNSVALTYITSNINNIS